MLVATQLLSAAEATVPYVGSFEDGEDTSMWVLNPFTPNAVDQWMIGSAVHSDGRNSLYISSDHLSPRFGSSPNITVAYMRVKFPEVGQQKTYDLSFDYRCGGAPNAAMLYVMVCPEVALSTQSMAPYYLQNYVSESKGILPNTTLLQCQKIDLDAKSYLNGQDSWTNVSLTNEIKVSNTNSKQPFAIVFIWVNNSKDVEQPVSACIDNVQLAPATVKKPQNLRVDALCEDSMLLVSWESTLSEFVVEYRTTGMNTWRRSDGITDGIQNFSRHSLQCEYLLPRIKEGSYDVRVKGYLNSDTSAYVVKSAATMWCPDNHCINYYSLYNPNLVCTYGTCADPFQNVGFIDQGLDDKETRHTIVTDPTLYDEYTGYNLSMVPKGSLAAVRLGNPSTGSQAESMTYSFVVDAANSGIVFIRYAVVLQDPGSSHSRDEEPEFTVVLLDEDDREIDAFCGKAVFSYSEAVDAGWNIHQEKDASGNPTGSQYAWKNWTSLGFNLQAYGGQTVKVRFITKDCSQGGHFGYAYFTADCVSAYIETENCGAESMITCYAPEGFLYEWRDSKGNIVSNSNVLNVAPYVETYTCKLTFKDSPDCFFELSTESAPRFPVPAYTYVNEFKDCESHLRFRNTSHVMTRYEDVEKHTQERCKDYYWEFRRLSDGAVLTSYNENPLYLCPSEGDSIEVTCVAYIGVDNACDSVRVDTIVVPYILPRDSDIYMEVCANEPVYFGGKYLENPTSGNYYDVVPNFAGCDSTATLHLTVHPLPAVVHFPKDTICSDTCKRVAGNCYSEAGSYLVRLTNRFGCDSIITFEIDVNERISLDAKTDVPATLCADDSKLVFDYSIMSGEYDSVQVLFDENAHAAGLRDTTIHGFLAENWSVEYPETVVPGYYTCEVLFYQYCCRTTRLQYAVEIHYASRVAEQKWNDVIAVLNQKYNGGYKFVGFQWLKNGDPIPGETHSYLYQPLDAQSEYSVLLTRDDGVVISSCPIVPTKHEDKHSFPTIVTASQSIPVQMPKRGTVRFVTVTGRVYSSTSLPEGEGAVTAPAIPGVYVAEIKSEGEKSQTQQMIVTQ